MTKYEACLPKHTWEIAGEDVPAFERDMDRICDAARGRGADLTQLVEARKVAVDERVTWKCRIPLCECYGQCHMDPPLSPTAEETAKVVGKYEYAILTDIGMELPKDYWDFIQTEDLPLCRFQYTDEAMEFERHTQIPLWNKLHEIVMGIERDAHNLGYLFAMGYVASTCYLCYDPSNPIAYCDTSKPCRRPYEARPSMEASGMDVFSTYRNAGLQLRLASPERLSWSGLVLIV
jgi:predicted metal-binding protein